MGVAQAADAFRITSPQSGATVSRTVPISVKYKATVGSLAFYVDGNLLGLSNATTYYWNSATVNNGSHTISVNAYSSSNTLVRTASVKVTVSKSGRRRQAPTQTTTPTATATATSSASSTDTATATATKTATWTATSTPTATATPTFTPTATQTPTLTPTSSQTQTRTATQTATPTKIATTTLTSTPTATSTPVACTTMPGTSTQVGAACLARSSYPALVNPQDPVSYGADKTGVNDSTIAFQDAVNTGDLNISQPGTYRIDGGNGVIPPSNRRIECAAGVTLKTTLHDSAFTAIFNIGWSGPVSNVTIAGCDFQGANVGSGPRPLDSNQFNFLVVMGGNSSGLVAEGNTFEYPFANSALEIFGCSNCTVQYNTFSHSALYGPNVQYGTNVLLQNNISTDGDMGWEDNECPGTQPGTGTLTNNELIYQNGTCARLGNSGCPNGVNIYGGGYPAGCNYSSINVNKNYCAGTDSVQHATIYNQDSGGGYPNYNNNILGPGCSCLSGGSC